MTYLSLKQQIQKRFGHLAFRQTRLTLGLALSVGFLLAVAQIIWDFQSQKGRVFEQFERMINTTSPTAAEALWSLDEELAKGVTQGLTSHPLIGSARIESYNGVVLSEHTAPREETKAGLFDFLFGRFNRVETVPLYHYSGNGTNQLGSLTLEIDGRDAWAQFSERVSFVLVAGLLRALILAAVLYALFYKTLTKPIAQYIEWLKRLNPDAPEEWTDSEPAVKDGYDLTEFGHLAASRFYQARQHFLDLEKTREELKSLNAELEQRVEERTAELNTALAHAEKLASTDPLTGLSNRRSFFELAEQRHAEWLRHHRPYALLMLDLDRFKYINDNYGHPVGDLVLQHVAKILTETKRKEDLLCRYGGEEFALLLPVTDDADIAGLAERFCKAIAERPVPLGESELTVTASFGLLPADALLNDFDKNVIRVDQVLYKAKESGRNQVAVHGE